MNSTAKSSGYRPSLAALVAEDCRRAMVDCLDSFVRGAWHVLHPGRRLDWLPYLDGICFNLEAVAAGEPWARRLLITQPPNTLKSTIASVCFPAWRWLKAPEHRFLCVANDGPLATRDAVAMRDLITSDWYV